MTDSTVVAIDAGTTGVRSMAFDARGTPIALAYREFPQHFPKPGWVEHDPADIWTAVQATLAEIAPVLSGPVAAIGITNQRETVVSWDRRTGVVPARAIVWQDRRTAARCEQLSAEGALREVRSRTGLVLDPYFSGTKMAWLLTDGAVHPSPGLTLATVDSWILWNLTGGTDGGLVATDASNASRTMLYDIRKQSWSPELCDLLGVPMDVLAEVLPSAGRFGVTTSDCALGAGIPIAGIAGDQQASLFGQACLQPGMAKNTYGTGSFVLMNVGEACPDPIDGLLTTIAWTVPGSVVGSSASSVTHYALEGAIFVTGAAVQWLRDGLGLIADAGETESLAASVADSGGVVMVPAFTGLGAPWWDPHARGTIVGLTRGTTTAHLARAVVDSMALQTRDVVDAMARASGRTLSELRVDGGASAMGLLLQLQADQLGIPVRRSAVPETTALGAAFLAGIAEGVWPDADSVDQAWSSDAMADPSADRTTADALHRQWLRGVERSRNWSD